MRKWENEKMRKWENEKMRKWENEKMRKWENEKMRKWEKLNPNLKNFSGGLNLSWDSDMIGFT